MNVIFPFSWECHHPKWRTAHIFQGGRRKTTNQILQVGPSIDAMSPVMSDRARSSPPGCYLRCTPRSPGNRGSSASDRARCTWISSRLSDGDVWWCRAFALSGFFKSTRVELIGDMTCWCLLKQFVESIQVMFLNFSGNTLESIGIHFGAISWGSSMPGKTRRLTPRWSFMWWNPTWRTTPGSHRCTPSWWRTRRPWSRCRCWWRWRMKSRSSRSGRRGKVKKYGK